MACCMQYHVVLWQGRFIHSDLLSTVRVALYTPSSEKSCDGAGTEVPDGTMLSVCTVSERTFHVANDHKLNWVTCCFNVLTQ